MDLTIDRNLPHRCPLVIRDIILEYSQKTYISLIIYEFNERNLSKYITTYLIDSEEEYFDIIEKVHKDYCLNPSSKDLNCNDCEYCGECDGCEDYVIVGGKYRLCKKSELCQKCKWDESDDYIDAEYHICDGDHENFEIICDDKPDWLNDLKNKKSKILICDESFD